MMMEPEHRSQVEYALERALTDEELVVVADLAALPPSHLEVIEQLYRRNLIAALYYVRAVTDDIDPSTLRRYVHGFDNLIAQRDKRTGLLARRFYESELGRELTADEMLGASSLDSITRVQRDVARALAVKDHSLALAYLRDLCSYASSQERQMFLESLPRAE
jgi:hypothetical protein